MYTRVVGGKRKRASKSTVMKRPRIGAFQRIPASASGYARVGGYYGRFSGGPGSENKFFDTAISFTEIPATGQLVLIPQGVTESTRVGRSCVIKSIQVRLNLLFAPATAVNASSNMFLYLVQDTQCNGAAAAVTDVLTANTFATALTNLENSQRFRVLRRWKLNFTASAGVTTAYNTVAKTLDYYKKCNIPMDYSDVTGAIGTIRSNNIFLMAGTDGQSDDTINVSGTARVRFSDKN